MKKLYILLLLIIFSTNTFAQIKFAKGYFINNDDERVECKIKNRDWKNNPTEIEYQLTENGEKKLASIQSVKEFGIDDVSKYIRAKVSVDKSKNKIGELSHQKDPIYKDEIVFLKVLIEGKATLYYYEESNIHKFYYTLDQGNITPLVYKKYLYSKETAPNTIAQGDAMDAKKSGIATNETYKIQLKKDLQCAAMDDKSTESLSYQKRELISYFSEFNNCTNEKFTNFDSKGRKKNFHINIRPGINISSYSMENQTIDARNAYFETQTSLRIGLEAEFILPFNNNKWAIFVEPTYQSFKGEYVSDYTTPNGTYILPVIIKYNSIEIPLGVRHYFYLNEQSKLFVDVAFVADFAFNSTIDLAYYPDLEIGSNGNGAIGVGFKYNNKYSIQARYQTPRELLGKYPNYTSNYKTVSLIFGYTIF